MESRASCLGRDRKQGLRRRVSAVQLDKNDTGDALQHEAGPGVGLDRRFLAQPHFNKHQARIVGIDDHRLDRADIDTAKFHRIADREPAYRVWEMDAVDQDGEVLDILVQPRRNKPTAKRFFRKLLKGLRYIPRVLITDKPGSDAAAKAEIMPGVVHLRDKGKNNRAENSHQPIPEREKRMRGFKPSGHAQRFLATFGVIAPRFFAPVATCWR